MNRFTELWRRLERVSPAPYDFNDGISQQQLIYGIGLVAHEFEALQQIVMQLFSVICGADRDAWNFRLSGILAVTTSFSMKLKFCKEAAEQFHLAPVRAQALNKWLDLAGRASDRRNDIVHGRLVIHQNETGPQQAVILPPTFDRRRGGILTSSSQQPAYKYNPEQVQSYADAIGRVSGNLITVMMLLAGDEAEAGDEWMLDPSALVR